MVDKRARVGMAEHVDKCVTPRTLRTPTRRARAKMGVQILRMSRIALLLLVQLRPATSNANVFTSEGNAPPDALLCDTNEDCTSHCTVGAPPI